VTAGKTCARTRIGRALTPAVLIAAGAATPVHAQTIAAPPFTVGDTMVKQGSFEAIALSRDTIVSTYPRAAREVRFRFSINGLENEFPGGTEHTIYLRPRGGKLTTALYTFGVEDAPPPPTPEQSSSSEDGTALVTFRIDMRHVLQSLRAKGYYDPPLGARVTGAAPLHVYVLGEPAPLSWDYATLKPGIVAELHDPDGDGIYEATVPIPTEYTRPTDAQGRGIWARTADLGAFPALQSSQRMQDAVYRMSLEELTQLVRKDGALSAGAKWEGVWTRDVSLSTVLSLAIVAPEAARRSLMAKVDSTGRIIQDTGTGGSWPTSSDRMVWALAAWEVYATTGDRAWLRQSYDIISRSALADLHAVRDHTTGLYDGESSFMDWREQSYPRWMQPADIAESQSLSNNAVHYAAYRVLANMARALGKPAAESTRWDGVANGIRRGMTTYLWQPDRGWFGEYRYGRNYLSLSPRAEGLGEALASIYGAASRAQRESLMRNAPVMQFGTPSFWPFIPGERFYHNATIWPFVTAYWTWAAAEGGNTTAVQHGLDDATRTAALFLTNKENTVAATGHFEGTALNSDRQLWSVAGTLAGTYRLLFGMRFEPDRLVLTPMVPPSYAGDRTLRGVKYRGAVLTITVHGYGDAVRSAALDGKSIARAVVPATLTGAHTVEITMNGRWPVTAVHTVAARFAPATPHASLHGRRLAWTPVPGATHYVLYQDGRRSSGTTRDTTIAIPLFVGLVEYQVLAVNAAGDESFLSEPVRDVPAQDEHLVKPATSLEHDHTGYTGAGYVRLTRDSNTTVTVPVRVEDDGDYAIDVRYANGNGPVNTEDKVAVRTLVVDRDTTGVIVMPQRGVNRWDEWGWSDPRHVHLMAGTHTISLVYTPLDANMNRRENTALLDAFRITRLAPVVITR